jgi:CBS domain-containing protein
MSKNVISATPWATVAQALEIMSRARVSGLPVVDEHGHLVGIISEADFLRRCELGTEKPNPGWLTSFFLPGRAAETYARAHASRVDEIMTTDVATLGEDASLEEAVALMEKRRVRRLPVMRGGKLVGMITRADFIAALARLARASYERVKLDDAEIKRRIETEMRAQPWAPTASSDVDVVDGVVTLRGVLTDDRQRRALHALVASISGVRMIHDHMAWAEPFSGTVIESPDETT